jgi:hypothetical protein
VMIRSILQEVKTCEPHIIKVTQTKLRGNE